MIRVVAAAGILAVLLSGCTRSFEKYITTNKGVIIIYGKNFAYTSFKPAGWYSDKLVIQTNNFSLYIHPTNDSEPLIYSYGVVLTNVSGAHSALAEDLVQAIYVKDLMADNQTEISKSPTTYRIDKAKEVYAYRITNLKKTKGIYQEVICVIWERAAVLVACRSTDPKKFEESLPVFNQFLSTVKYWGYNSDDLANRVIKLFFNPKK